MFEPIGQISVQAGPPSTSNRVVTAAVWRPLDASPSKSVAFAASASRWNGWGSNCPANPRICSSSTRSVPLWNRCPTRRSSRKRAEFSLPGWVSAMSGPLYKQRLLEADEEGTLRTVLFGYGWPNAPHRTLPTALVEQWIGKEARGQESRPDEPEVGRTVVAGGAMPVLRFMGFPPNREATGDIDSMDLLAGQGVGLVRQIKPAGQIVQELVDEARQIISSGLIGLVLAAGGPGLTDRRPRIRSMPPSPSARERQRVRGLTIADPQGEAAVEERRPPPARRRSSACRAPNSDSSRTSSAFVHTISGGRSRSESRTPIAPRKTRDRPMKLSSRPRQCAAADDPALPGGADDRPSGPGLRARAQHGRTRRILRQGLVLRPLRPEPYDKSPPGLSLTSL